MKQTAIVVAPGRGTYNRSELVYLKLHHAQQQKLFAEFDEFRRQKSQIPITELDGVARFSGAKFTKGENASPLNLLL